MDTNASNCSAAIQIRRLSVPEARECVSALAEVLVDCVDGGASVSFMWPFTQREAEEFFRKAADGVAKGERILPAAFESSKLGGTVQIVTAMPPNQPHRAEVSKLLVHRSATGEHIEAFEIRRVRKDGRVATISLKLSPIKDSVDVSAIAGDITEQKQTEVSFARVTNSRPYCVASSISSCRKSSSMCPFLPLRIHY